MEEKELFRTTENFMVLQICKILEENNIPYVRRNDGVSSYLNIAWGSNNGETKIFVSSEDYERAVSLIQVLTPTNIEEENYEIPEELKEIVDEEEMEKDIKKYNNMKKFLYFWAPVIMIAIIIIACIMANI